MSSNFLRKGFTLIETIVGVAVFLTIATASYQAYLGVFKLVNASQYRITAINLINEQFEIAHNLPYADVGIIGGLPVGKIPNVQTIVRGGYTFTATTTVRNVDLAFDGTIGGTVNDLSPADNKIIEVEIGCATCKDFTPVVLTTQIAPKNLETASSNGALFVRVFDASGIAVPNADVVITNAAGTSTIVDSTNNNGILQIIDIAPAIESYNINVSKSGYSSDQTYKNSDVSPSASLKLPASVLLQQVTQTSFAIDRLSSLSFSSVTSSCTPVPSFDFKLQGSKRKGQLPDLYKYSSNLITDSSGIKNVSNLEWDTYSLTAIDSLYDLIGVNPLNPIALNPNSTQQVKLIVALKNPNMLLVTVKDSTTQLPLTDVTVNLDGVEKVTGRGFLTQTDWTGTGQITDGNIDYLGTPGEFKLASSFGAYVPHGELESSVFDTGVASNFQQFVWRPEYVPPSTGSNAVRFQIATAASSTGPWVYRGPDAATSTYYTNPDSTIHSIHDGDRYIKYRAYLETVTSTTTPSVSDVSFTFTTDCTPPGQVYFSGLSNSTYTLTVSKAGYSTTTMPITISSPWKEQEIILAP